MPRFSSLPSPTKKNVNPSSNPVRCSRSELRPRPPFNSRNDPSLHCETAAPPGHLHNNPDTASTSDFLYGNPPPQHRHYLSMPDSTPIHLATPIHARAISSTEPSPTPDQRSAIDHTFPSSATNPHRSCPCFPRSHPFDHLLLFHPLHNRSSPDRASVAGASCHNTLHFLHLLPTKSTPTILTHL